MIDGSKKKGDMGGRETGVKGKGGEKNRRQKILGDKIV